MADRSPGLWVAMVAGVLLLVVVAADATITRSVTLSVETDEGDWHEIATTKDNLYDRPGGEVVLERNRSDEVTLRVAVDNEPPWAYEEDYVLRSSGRDLASGTLAAEGRSTAADTVTVTVDELLHESPSTRGGHQFTDVQLSIGTDHLYGGLSIQEVPR